MELIRDDIDLTAYMTEQPQEHRVLAASDWLQDVADFYHKPDTSPKVRMGWLRTQGDFAFRDAEVTLWAGINGHGKSQLVGQVALDLMVQNQRVCIASLEMRPTRVMARMSRQAFGDDLPSQTFLKTFHDWSDGRLWLYDHVGSSNPKTMLAVIRYARDKFGIQHFVVDNLAKVIAGEDSYNEQKDFVNSLCVVAQDTGVHIHLVLHMKKGRTEDDVPGKFDIKGSGAISDLVENVFIVWRNKKKEGDMRMGGGDSVATDPDCVLLLTKQRNGETEGRYPLYFDHRSLQYIEAHNDFPKQYKVERKITFEEIEF